MYWNCAASHHTFCDRSSVADTAKHRDGALSQLITWLERVCTNAQGGNRSAKARCTQQELAKKLRRAAWRVRGERDRGVKALRLARDGSNENMWVGCGRDLRRSTNGLSQEFADRAIVRVGSGVAGNYLSTKRHSLTDRVVRGMLLGISRVNDDAAVMVMAIIGREQVQTLTEKRNAGVSGQQGASQEFAKGWTHGGKLAAQGMGLWRVGGDLHCRFGTPCGARRIFGPST